MNRKFFYLIGVNGAGKTTVGAQLQAACGKQGLTVHLDSETDAFSPELDATVSLLPGDEAASLLAGQAACLVQQWIASDFDVVVVDRWLESFDVELPEDLVGGLLAKLELAGFELYPVHLVVGHDALSDDLESMVARTRHNRATRTPAWWGRGTGSVETRAQAEVDYQVSYRKFASRLPNLATICTVDKAWPEYTAAILETAGLLAKA